MRKFTYNRSISFKIAIIIGIFVLVIINSVTGCGKAVFDGSEVYWVNDADSGEFSIVIKKAGTYTFSVAGNNSKGSVSFIVSK